MFDRSFVSLLVFFLLNIVFHVQAHAEELIVLTSSSVLGKNSLGEFLEKEFPSFCKECHVKFKSTNEISGLIGQLRLEKNKKKTHSFDAVLGLDSRQYNQAHREGLVKTGQSYDQSPMAIIVDTRRFPKTAWPENWSQVADKLQDSILISDPRLSSPGFNWLVSIFVLKLQTLVSSKKIVHRIFPSWSASYSAFLKGEGKAVWSYQSSEAYHRCNEKTEADKQRYLALPLKEGYPSQSEYFAEASFSKNSLAPKFASFIVSPLVQKKIPLLNWMFPVVPGTELPDCFKSVTPIKVSSSSIEFSQQEMQSWTDQWAL